MGAAWVLQNKYTIILLPKFEFKEIKGAINPRQIGLKLDENTTDVKERLGELKNNLIQEFELSQMSEFRWERKRDDFISKIKERALNNKIYKTQCRGKFYGINQMFRMRKGNL